MAARIEPPTLKVLDIAALTRVVDAFEDGDWTHEIIIYSATKPTTLAKPALRFAQEKVDASFERGHAGRAFNWAFLLLQFTRGAILDDTRFCELFRPTKHEAHISKLTSVLNRLCEQTRASGLVAASDTFASWACFSDFFTEVLKVEKTVLEAIRSTHRALAWLVSYVEEIFAFEQEVGHPPTLEKRDRYDLGKEETATAVSYLLGRYFHRWGFSTRDFPILKQPTEPPRAIADILLQAYALVEVRSLEPTLFRFGSRCTWASKTTIEVVHPNDTIDVSLELGYIKTQHAAMSAPNVPMDDRVRFKEICDGFQRDLSPKFLTYAASGPPRLRIEMPEPVARVLSEKIIMAPGIFAEEMSELLSLCWELSTTAEELETFRVTPHLTLINLLQIGRLFRLFASARNEHLRAMRDSDPVCYWNSMLGGSPSKEELIRMLSLTGIADEMAEEYVDLFVWRPEDSRPLDLQYTSFLPFGNRLAIPFNVHANSNAMRNALMLQRKRLYEDASADPLSPMLHSALATRTPHAFLGLNYRWQQHQSDIDALALIDDCLYAFECKNTLLPCSAFERRTLWDYLQKAVDQLDLFRELCESDDFRKYLAKKLRWPITATTKVRTCIVPSVRLFSGAYLQGHPVRHSRELINILGRGAGAVSSASGEILQLNLWRAPDFSTAVLDEYLSENSAFYQAHWSAMNLEWEQFEAGRYSAKNRRYILDLVRLEHELRERGFVVA